MIHSRKLIAYVFTVGLLLLAGCSHEMPVEPINPSGGDETISIKMSLDIEQSRSTKGLTGIQEDDIKTIDVLIFDSNDKLFDVQNGIITVNSGVTSFEAKYRISKHGGDSYRPVVLANSRSKINALFGGALIDSQKGKTYAAIMAMLEDNAFTTYSDWNTTGLPMWGEYVKPILIESGAKLPPMSLTRSIVRIDVGTNKLPSYNSDGSVIWDKIAPFSLEEVIIYKAGKKYMIAPNRSDYDFSARRVSKVNLPVSQTLFSPHPKYKVENSGRDGNVPTGKGVHISSMIYLPEADVNMGAGARYLDSNHLNRIAIVVGGKYKSNATLSYYRIDFVTPEDRTKLEDLKRNHCYQAVINDVVGGGFTDPDDAYRSYVSEIDATINDWEKGSEVGVIFDGENKLAFSRDMVFCGNEGSISGPITNVVKTTNLTDELKITGPFAKDMNGTAWIISPSISSVTTETDPKLGEVKTATISIGQITPFANGREAYFLVKSGNMEYEYRIVQDKDKWITIKPFPDGNCYPMDGDLHWMNATSKTDWEVELSGGNQSDVVTDLHTRRGGRKAGELVYFNTFNDLNKGLKEEAHVTFAYTDPKGVCPAETITVPVVTGMEIPTAQESNCYILDPIATTKSGIYIPIGRANQAIANSIGEMDVLSSEFIWTDNSAGGGKDNSSVKYWVKSGRGKTGYLFVQQGKTNRAADGNTVMAIKTAANNTIRWSWHIWTTNYAPGNGIGTKKLMDRNLGALKNVWADGIFPNFVEIYTLYPFHADDAIGMYYQWGRKDPKPATNRPVYFGAFTVNSTNTLANSIGNPTAFIKGWSAPALTQSWAATKTIYDPCPYGWQVPGAVWGNNNVTKLNGGAGNGFSAFNNGIRTFEGGNYLFGCLYNNDGVLNSGTQGTKGGGFFYTYNLSGTLPFYLGMSFDDINTSLTGGGKSNAMNVRCVKQ